MSNSTAVVPFDQLNTMAKAFAQSGMFGAKNPEQALSLLLLAQAEGVHPAIAMRDYDIINGKPSKKAQAMHRAFLEAGGKIEWHRRDDTGADATFSHAQGGTVRVSWDAERAKKAGLSSKDMYGKYVRQMYSARVISEGCRTVYPAATSGLYVPEEVREFKPAEKDMGSAPVVQDEPVSSATQEVTLAHNPSSTPSAESVVAAFISLEQAMDLAQALADCDPKAQADFLKVAKIERLDELRAEVDGADMYAGAIEWIARRKAAKKK